MLNYGDVYIKDPLSGELLWQDWCAYIDYVSRYAQSAAQFLWVLTK